jgi:uncharacterized GH25 family protein
MTKIYPFLPRTVKGGTVFVGDFVMCDKGLKNVQVQITFRFLSYGNIRVADNVL